MEEKFIWLSDLVETENERGLFYHSFMVTDPECEYLLSLTACTRYVATLNGKTLGQGPIRSGRETLYYDSYEIASLLQMGKNELCVRVWNYGWSTYQSVAGKGALCFEIMKDGEPFICSGEDTLCRRDSGHQYHAVKRNVNLGFTDYYDARKEAETICIPATMIKAPVTVVKRRPIRSYHTSIKYPEHVVSIQDMRAGCQQVSVNTRKAFFGDRRDADETIFSGFLGCVLESPYAMEGKIIFPNRTWNGLFGDFKLNGVYYHTSDENREIAVTLKKGRQLFLMQLSGKYDDLYSHMEFIFPAKLSFQALNAQEEGKFWVIGPTTVLKQMLDGRSRVYGGLDEFNRLEEHSQEHESIFACTMEDIQQQPVRYVEPEYVFFDEYIYSLVKNAHVFRSYPVEEKHLGILWDNLQNTVIEIPPECSFRRLIVDFKELYVGNLEFTLWARSGTVVDIYCYENMFLEEIDYTIGLNNAIRYTCKEGWQTYFCMSRIGCRFALVEIREQRGPVKIQKLCMHFSTYAPSNRGSFVCDDYLLNKIWDTSKQTHLLCMEDAFTDCPTWEQSFWIGDAQISAGVNAYLYGEYDFIRHNLCLAAEATENTPLMNALTPTDWNTSIPMWMMNWVVAIHQYVEVSNDRSLITELYPTVKATLLYYGGLVEEGGAFIINAWNMLDWADMDIHNHGVVTGQQALLAHCFLIAAEFAKELGIQEEIEVFEAYRSKLLTYIDTTLWDDSRKMYVDGYSPEYGFSKTVSIQTHVLLSLFNAIIDNKKAVRVREYLENTPEEFVQIGSPFMLFYLYEVWAKQGKMQQIIYDMKVRYGKMLYYDSTTCWEVFPGFYENGRTRSYCHGWSAAPVYFLGKYLLGIEQIKNGFQKIRLSMPDTVELGWIRGSIPTPFGDIRVVICREEEKTYHITLPKEIEVEYQDEFPYRVTISYYS